MSYRIPRAALIGLLSTLAAPWGAEAARSVTLAWDPSTSTVAGYELMYGAASGSYTTTVNVGAATLYTVPNLSETSDYYFAVRAYTSGGVRSVLSAEVVSPATMSGPLMLSRTSLRFGTLAGTAATTSTQTVLVTLQNPSSAWTATSNQPWLQVTPASGTGSGAFNVRLTPGYPLSAGQFSASVTVSLSGNPSAARTIQVSLAVNGATAPPIGMLETPGNGAGNVTGAIAVTGWSLDDVEVRSVEIYRSPVAGEGNLVFIGTAAFVADARPDVEAAFPTYPAAYRAGWGYMLLTNMLPDQYAHMPTGGNGPFTLHAFGVDAEGRRALLGSTTITCTNSSATKPFGTIDTPAQGGVVSGRVTNVGWVLSPSGRIPEDGSTITVYVDGVAMGHAQYNIYREDVFGLFPGYSNSSGAAAIFDLDTTRLTNGTHTIAWGVSDVQGNAEGIGSRYFTVANGGAAAFTAAAATSTTITSATAAMTSAPASAAPATVSTGYVGEPQVIYPEQSVLRVAGTMLEPVRVELGAEPGVSYEGFLRVGRKLRDLPIGARLDPGTGTFTWQPGPAFSGEYELMFIRNYPSGEKERVPVIVSLSSPDERPTPDRRR